MNASSKTSLLRLADGNEPHTPSTNIHMDIRKCPARKGNVSINNTAEPSGIPQELEYLAGWRLYGTTLTCQLCIFLANLEVSIVSTTLIDITDSLHSYNRSSWVITSYLLTYTGFLIIWSKLSDSLGRRQCLCAAIIVFIAASGACGGAQTATQLITFRAFQGIGGSGLLSVTFVMLPEMVEPRRYALWVTFTSCAFVVGFLLGPLLGGAIVASASWRWIFLLNLPLGAVTLAFMLTFIPVGFPDNTSSTGRFNANRLKEIDLVGAFLVFGACATLVSALEEAGSTYSWSSPVIVILLIFSAVFTVAFPFWEARVDRSLGQAHAMLRPKLMRQPVFLGSLIITFFAGVNFTVSVIQIPQEWQTVSGASPLLAGIRLLPFTILYSFGSVLAAILTSKLNVPPFFVVLMGAGLQIISTCVVSLVPLRNGPGKYVCECLLGLGTGENISIMIQMVPHLVKGKEQAAAIGATTQFRALGGVLGFAITTNVFNAYIEKHLSSLLTPSQLEALLRSGTQMEGLLEPMVQKSVIDVFAQAYNIETMTLIGFGVAQVAGLGILWRIRFQKLG